MKTHKPIQPPRPSFVGECVYASMWEALMTAPPDHRDGVPMFHKVLGAFDLPSTQRHASVLASVVCWLGTNCGRAMLDKAERKRDNGEWSRNEAYFLSWSLQNRRRAGHNGGLRMLEILLTPPSTPVHLQQPGTIDEPEPPRLTADEVEVVDHLMHWLAEREGQDFLQQCEHEIKRLLDAHSLAQRAAWLRENYTAPAAAVS